MAHTFAIASLSYYSLIGGISEPGNTPVSKFDNKGMSSAINFGTTVSQTLLNKIFYSNSINS